MASIRKRTWRSPNGKLQTRWLVDYQDGLGRRRAKQFVTREEARAWVEKTDLKQLDAGKPATVTEVARAWVKKRETEGLERTTINYYRHMAEKYIIPAFGHLRTDKLTQSQVIDHWDHLRKTKSDHMGRSFVRHLKMMLNFAIRADLVGKNVAADLRTTVRSRTRRRQRPSIPTPEEVRAIIGAIEAKPRKPKPRKGSTLRKPLLKNPKWLARLRRRPLFMTLHETGIRPSEARGLPWRCVHLDEGYIEIEQRADRYNKIGDCKTNASYRSVPIPSKLSKALEAWKKVCPASTKDLVFPTASGRPMSSRWIAKEFKQIQISAGVVEPLLDQEGNPLVNARGKPRVQGKYRLYAMRHLRASKWIDDRLNLKRLQSRMGHSSIQVTFDVYGHLLSDDDEDNGGSPISR